VTEQMLLTRSKGRKTRVDCSTSDGKKCPDGNWKPPNFVLFPSFHCLLSNSRCGEEWA